MACGDVIAAQFLRSGEQLPQLYMLVAVHTGIGRPPAFVLRNEVIDHLLTETVAEVKHVMGKTQLFRCFLGVRYINSTAVVLIPKPDVPAVKHFQRDADYVVTRFL